MTAEPLVVALASPDAPERELAAGFEEEGVPLTLDRAADGASAVALAREAASRSALGIGVGADSDRLALVLAAAPRRAYLEAATADARRFAHNAARLAARRPLR